MKNIIFTKTMRLTVLMFLCLLSACQKTSESVDPTPVLTFATPSALTCSEGCMNVATSSIPTGGAITYTISDVTVATVNASTGAITPVAAGIATVTATQAALGGKNATAKATYALTILGLSITSFTPDFGGVGYSVVITGTNFDGVTAANNSVKINGVQTATPTSISTTSLTVLVPRGARGAGNITVTVGSKTASKGTFTEYATVTTFAGDGTQGWKDATGTSAQLWTPAGLAFDNSGHLIVADYGNNRIRSITTEGVVTTLAGDGSYDYLDGQGTAAELNAPWGVAVNKTSGYIFVTDRGDDHIRKISTAGKVTTYAGSTEGNGNGTNFANAQFYQPQGIAIDAFDNVYVADRWYSLIREAVSAGYVNTISGNNNSQYINGNGTASAFYFPDGLAIDPSGNNLFIADHTNNCIRKLVIQGATDASTFAGASVADNGTSGNKDGTGTDARFNGPSGLAIDSDGNVYVADTDNGLIRKITPAGFVTTVAGNSAFPGGDLYKDGLGPFTAIYQPLGVAVNASGDIYITDGTNRVRKIVQ